jgi:predicted methyltransferase
MAAKYQRHATRLSQPASHQFTGPLYARPKPPAGFPVVVSHIQIAPLAALYDERSPGAESLELETSADLGLSTVTVTLDEDGLHYPDGSTLAWPDARHIMATPNQCFEVTREVMREGALEAIARFSETTYALRSLMPTAGAPTMLVSGFSMHRIKGTEPWADTQAKIHALGAVTGRVLDTTTGLGYTALMAARAASAVVTVELDPVALEIARRNPWSSELFTRPNIERRTGDAFDIVAELPASGYDRILHDPPYLSLAGDLYSEEMYRRLYRVLRAGGTLFHYIGDPRSQSGARVTAGVIRRLEAAGFQSIRRQPAAFGVTAMK